MLRKCNRFIALFLTIALFMTTCNGDIASIRAFAVDGESATELSSAPEEQAPEENQDVVLQIFPKKQQDVVDQLPEENQDAVDQAPEGNQEAVDQAPEENQEAVNQTPEENQDVVDQLPAEGQNNADQPSEDEQLSVVDQLTTDATLVEKTVEEKPVETTPEVISSENIADGTQKLSEEAEVPEKIDEEAEKLNKKKVSDEENELEEKKSLLSLDPNAVSTDVTIHYSASEGGKVDPESETVGENGEISGSTATADEGYKFICWKDSEGNELTTDNPFCPSTEGLEDGVTFTAYFDAITREVVNHEYTVIFELDGGEVYRQAVYTDEDNELSIPERPFKAGYYFLGWKYDGEFVSEGMIVDKDMTITAQFQEIELYELSVEYYYINPKTGSEVPFDSASKSVAKDGFPTTFNSPSNVSVTSEVDEAHPVYYPSADSVTFTTDDIDYSIEPTYEDGVAKLTLPKKRVQYIPYNVFYYQYYMLKDLTGDGYTEVESARDKIEGNLGLMITPSVKNIEGGIFERTESALLENEDQIYYVYYTRANYTLHYNSNGGSYIDAVAAAYGSVLTVSDTQPTKQGYSFEGWYYDEAFTQIVGSTIELKKDTTIYAKWEAVPVNYTVMYLIENADDDGYSFIGSIVKQAVVGSTVTETASGQKPSNLDKDNFTFKESTSATVEADGTTVIQVKYSRNVYTITWKGVRYKYNSRRDSFSITTESGRASLTAKFGSTITDKWTENFNEPYPNWAWNFTTENKDKFVNIDTMPSGNKEVYAYDYTTTKVQYLRYWLENYEGEASLDDGTKTVVRDGKTYGLLKNQKVNFGYLYFDSEFYEIDGYTRTINDYTATYTDWWGNTRSYTLGNETPDYELNVDFYYKAKSYPLTFYNFDGTLISTQNVTHGSDISEYLTSNIPSAPVDGSTWLGWYTDADHFAPYAGNNKMDLGLALYANFKLPSFTITFVDGETEIQTDTYEYLQNAQSISLDDKPGFTFGGWYTEATTVHAYDFAKPMTENITVYARWIPKQLSYIVKYVSAETGEEIADQKIVTSPVLKKGSTVTEKAISITGMIADEVSKSLVLDYEGNVITFTYSKREGTLKYTVKYVLKDNHDIQVHAPKVDVTVPSSVISVTVAAAAVDKDYMRANYPDMEVEDYYPEQDVISYTLSTGTNEIVFEYNSYASGRVIVHYVDMAGAPIVGIDDVIATGKAGNTYQIDTQVEGYTYKKLTDGKKEINSTVVSFKDGTVERYVYLQKNLTIRAKNKNKEYDGTPLVSSGIGDAEVEGILAGHALSSISYSGSQTEGGSSATTPCDAVIAGAVDDYYNIIYVPGTLTVSKKNITVTIVGDIVPTVYDGNEHTANYRVTISDPSFLESYLQFNGAEESVSLTHVGKKDLILKDMFSVKPEYAGSFNVSISATNGYVEVTPATITVWTETLRKVYDGKPLKSDDNNEAAYSITGLVNGETLVFEGFRSVRTDVGEEWNEIIDFDWSKGTANQSDYKFNWKNGKLIITKATATVTVKGNKETVNYDGEEHTVSGYTMKADNKAYDVDSFVNAPKQADVKATGTKVGNYPMNIEGFTFENTSDNFDVIFEYEDGGLEIIGSKEVQVKITGNKVSEEYDGNAHTAQGYTVEIKTPEGVAAYTEADFTFSGTDVVTKTDAGTYPMGLKESDFINDNTNYTVKFEVVDGQLDITKKDITVTITGNKDTKPYNKEEQSVSGYSVSISDSLYTEADFEGPSQSITASGTDASDTPYMMGLKESDFTNNNANFNVTFNVTDGQILITRRQVTVTVKGDQKTYVYNGEIQKAEGYSLTIEDSLYTEADFTAPAQTDAVAALKDVGEKNMNLTPDKFTNLDTTNYDVTFAVDDGWVKITPVTDEYEIRVKGNKDSVEYDGQEHSVSGYVTESPVPDSITFTLKDGKAVAKGTDVGNYSMKLSSDDFTATSINYSNIKITIVEDGILEITPSNRPDDTLPTVTGYEGVYDGASHGITISGGLPGDNYKYSYIVAGTEYEDQSAAPTATHVNESVSMIIVTVSNHNYKDVPLKAVEIKINPKEITVTTGSAEKEYDGTALTENTAGATGFITGESAKVSATGTIIEVGDTPNTYSIEWDKAEETDYTVAEDLGTLTITTSTTKIVFRAASDSKVYDGKALTNAGASVSGLPEGFTAEAEAEGSQTDVGEGVNRVKDNYIIKNRDGEDRTANFTNIEKLDGKLTVTPKAVTITTGSASKAYDGTPLTKDEAGITGLVSGESVTLKATGTITNVGSESNTYSIVWDKAKETNYTVTENLGTLTITKSDAEIIITAATNSKDYDGTELSDGGFVISGTGVPANHTFIVTVAGGQTDAGSSDNVITAYTIIDSDGVDKTSSFTNVELVKGTLTVNPKAVTITTGSASKPYDGTALTNSEAKITGLVNGEKVTVTATGSQTEVGDSENTYTADWGSVNRNNYNVTENLGTLTVVENDAAIIITAGSKSKVYDGTALTEPGFTVTGLPGTVTYQITTKGSITDAGTTANDIAEGYKFLVGSKDVTANFTNVTVVSGTLTVNPKAVTITTGSASKAYDGTALTSEEAGITGLVEGESAVVTATGTITEVGTEQNSYSINWNNAKKDNYAVTENLGTLEITANANEVTLTAATDSKTYDGTALTNSTVTFKGLPSGFTVQATAVGSQTDAGESSNVVADGFIIKNAAGEDRTSSFTNVKKENGTLTVNPKAVTITTGSASKAYDGTALTNEEAEITGLADGESVTLKATGTITNEGSTQNTYSISWDNAKEANYTVTDNLGTLTIVKSDAEIIITAATDSKIYDGTKLFNGGVDVTGLPEGHTAVTTVSGEQTDAGSSANKVISYKILDSTGADVTDSFTGIALVDGTLTVNPAPVTITTGSANKPYDGTPLTNSEADITGLVNGETATVTATGSQAEVGESDNTYSADWGTAKKSNYTITENLGTLKVNNNTSQITLTAATDSKTYDGTALTNNAVSAEGLPAAVTYVATAEGSITDAGSTANTVASGYKFMAGNKDVTDFFTNVTTVPGTLTVNQKDATITTGSASKAYDGTALTNSEASITGIISSENVTVTATGTITEVGDTTNTYAIVWDGVNASNYNIKEELGTLTITPNATKITFTAKTDSKVYDGTALANKNVSVSGLPSGFTAQAQAVGTQTDVGSSANTVGSYKILNAAGEDKTSSFTNVHTEDGTLTVTPKAVTIKTGSASKPYDGTPLTESQVEVTGLADGESITVSTTGSITDVGQADNTYTADWDNAKKANYTVTDNLGTLTVTKSDAEIILTAATDSKTYDGTELKAVGFTVSGPVPKGLTIEATISGSQKDAGSSANKITGYKIFNAEGIDKTDSFTKVELVDGKLTVNPAPAVITTGSANKAFDGTALTNDEASITGLVNSEKVTVKATGSQTEVGSSVNTYSASWGTVNKNNYTVNENLGTLKVTENTSQIVLTAASSSKVYDGTALTNKNVTATGLPGTITVKAQAEGTITEVGKAENKVAAGYRFMAGSKDVTDNFSNVKLVNGTLEITPLNVTVTVTGNKNPVKYDGGEHSVEGYKVQIDNRLYKEEDFTFTGTAKASATVPSKVNMNLAKDMFTNNNPNFEVNFVVEDGYVEILGLEDNEKFEIAASTSDVVRPYTGEVYSGFDFAVEGSAPGLLNRIADGIADILSPVTAGAADDTKSVKTVTIKGKTYTVSGLSVDTAEKDVGMYTLAISGEMKVTDEAGNDVTSQFKPLKKSEGILTIEPKVITVTSGSVTKTYDGTAAVNNEVTTDTSWGIGDSVDYSFTGTQTEVGSSQNTFTVVALGETKLSNYTINYVYGTLTVNPVPTPAPAPTPAGGAPTAGGTPAAPTPAATTPAAAAAPVAIADDAVPLAATAPDGAVLGAQRRTEGQVLGARRGRTSDDTNTTARAFAILIAAAISISLMIGFKKREEQEEDK